MNRDLFDRAVLGKDGPRFSIGEIPFEQFPYARFFFRVKRLSSEIWNGNTIKRIHFQPVGCRVREGEFRERIFYTTAKLLDKGKVHRNNRTEQLFPQFHDLYFAKNGKYYQLSFSGVCNYNPVCDFLNEHKETIIELKNPEDIIDLIIFKHYI
jgi:hypothetical protein